MRYLDLLAFKLFSHHHSELFFFFLNWWNIVIVEHNILSRGNLSFLLRAANHSSCPLTWIRKFNLHHLLSFLLVPTNFLASSRTEYKEVDPLWHSAGVPEMRKAIEIVCSLVISWISNQIVQREILACGNICLSERDIAINFSW